MVQVGSIFPLCFFFLRFLEVLGLRVFSFVEKMFMIISFCGSNGKYILVACVPHLQFMFPYVITLSLCSVIFDECSSFSIKNRPWDGK